jgi:hypothetical protein
MCHRGDEGWRGAAWRREEGQFEGATVRGARVRGCDGAKVRGWVGEGRCIVCI